MSKKTVNWSWKNLSRYSRNNLEVTSDIHIKVYGIGIREKIKSKITTKLEKNNKKYFKSYLRNLPSARFGYLDQQCWEPRDVSENRVQSHIA